MHTLSSFGFSLTYNNQRTIMSIPKVICFRATEAMCSSIDRIMDERLIDRTTVIKLALYYFDSYMRRMEVRNKTLFDIVNELENLAEPGQSCFAHFSMQPRHGS